MPAARRWEDEPPSGGWDSADTVTSSGEPIDDAALTPRNLPPVQAAQVTSAPGSVRGPYQTSPGVGGPPPLPASSGTAAHRGAGVAPGGGLGTAMREEVWAIVRAAVEEAMGPLVTRQRELEARVERADRERDAERTKGTRTAAPPVPVPAALGGGGGGASAASRLASIGPVGGPSSIPIAFGPSLAPPTFSAAHAAVPLFESESGGATLPDLETSPAAPLIRDKASAHPVGPRPSIPVGYGVNVIVAPRASLDLESVGPVDVEGFDGGRAKKRVAGIVVVMMLLLIAGLVTMTVLSHN